jgi:hypothetical protein
MKKLVFVWIMAMLPVALWAQFPPAAGLPGTTAMHADSSAFVAWATGCTTERGLMRIDKPHLGYASFGDDTLVLGKPGAGGASEIVYDVVSLGDGGIATVTFASPIFNGEGPDFAVFENGFDIDDPYDPSGILHFLELAFVEVSSDGENFFRFPAVTYVPFDRQLNGSAGIDPSQIHNFAGKYDQFYGTPFDLDEVEDNVLLNKNRVTHVRIIDVVGCIKPEYARYDSEDHIVNDPWFTSYDTGGFDLEAVGVIHDLAHNAIDENEMESVSLYPNPVKDQLFIKAQNLQSVEVYNIVGQQVMATENDVVDMAAWTEGIYFVRIHTGGKVITRRVVKQ